MVKIIELLKNKSVSFGEFYNYLREKDLGEWDNINSKETITNYITEMIKQDIKVNHILEAIENNSSSQELYLIWLGNSMEIPEPINTKEDLFKALNLKNE